MRVPTPFDAVDGAREGGSRAQALRARDPRRRRHRENEPHRRVVPDGASLIEFSVVI
jgi:hypothetical protein